MEKKIGHYAFLIGVLLAVLLGLASSQLGTAVAWITSLMVALGLIVGFLNVTGKETKEFLMVAVILVIVAALGNAAQNLGTVQYIGMYLSGIFSQIMAFVIPATIVVALKDIWALGQNE